MRKIIAQAISFDEHGQSLVTKFDDGSLLNEPISSEEAAQFQAENEY